MEENEVWERVFEGLAIASSCAREMAREFTSGTSGHKKAYDEFINLANQYDHMISIGRQMKMARALSEQANLQMIDQKIETMKAAENG